MHKQSRAVSVDRAPAPCTGTASTDLRNTAQDTTVARDRGDVSSTGGLLTRRMRPPDGPEFIGADADSPDCIGVTRRDVLQGCNP
jgi:hypothetical protein